jgi:hypothetical protein
MQAVTFIGKMIVQEVTIVYFHSVAPQGSTRGCSSQDGNQLLRLHLAYILACTTNLTHAARLGELAVQGVLSIASTQMASRL